VPPGLEQRFKERAPILEMPIKAALGHAQRISQPLDPHGLGAVLGKSLQPRVDPLLPAQSFAHSATIRCRIDSGNGPT
jgi:hypothetical protein